MLACSLANHHHCWYQGHAQKLEGFDFWDIQTVDIAVTSMALLLENYSKYFGDFSCWHSDERSFPFGLVLYVSVVLSDVVSKAYASTGFIVN